MTATEQTKIESAAPAYLRNIVVIISEMECVTRTNFSR